MSWLRGVSLCALAGLAWGVAAVRRVAYTFVRWALDNKNVDALKASLSHGDDFFMFQPHSRGTIAGYQEFLKLIPGWMSPDFKATKTELRQGQWVIVQAHFSLASDKVVEEYKQRQGASVAAP